MTRDYVYYSNLSGLYLADSYVLDIVESSAEVKFVLAAVLRSEQTRRIGTSNGTLRSAYSRFAAIMSRWVLRTRLAGLLTMGIRPGPVGSGDPEIWPVFVEFDEVCSAEEIET